MSVSAIGFSLPFPHYITQHKKKTSADNNFNEKRFFIFRVGQEDSIIFIIMYMYVILYIRHLIKKSIKSGPKNFI